MQDWLKSAELAHTTLQHMNSKMATSHVLALAGAQRAIHETEAKRRTLQLKLTRARAWLDKMCHQVVHCKDAQKHDIEIAV